jgi:hypothetical protein
MSAFPMKYERGIGPLRQMRPKKQGGGYVVASWKCVPKTGQTMLRSARARSAVRMTVNVAVSRHGGSQPRG